MRFVLKHIPTGYYLDHSQRTHHDLPMAKVLTASEASDLIRQHAPEPYVIVPVQVMQELPYE